MIYEFALTLVLTGLVPTHIALFKHDIVCQQTALMMNRLLGSEGVTACTKVITNGEL